MHICNFGIQSSNKIRLLVWLGFEKLRDVFEIIIDFLHARKLVQVNLEPIHCPIDLGNQEQVCERNLIAEAKLALFFLFVQQGLQS